MPHLTIADTRTPLVIFYGPRGGGKTMALLRMVRYLDANDYRVVPDNFLRPHTDVAYKRECESIMASAFSPYAEHRHTSGLMLLKALDPQAAPVCQFFVASGDLLYGDGVTNHEPPPFIHQIAALPNPRVWVFLVEKDWSTQDERDSYAKHVCDVEKHIPHGDKVIFLFAKADRSRDLYDNYGRPRRKAFFDAIRAQYPGIFARYRNTGLKALLRGRYRSKTLCFSAGHFSYDDEDRQIWAPGPDFYCQDLWRAITK